MALAGRPGGRVLGENQPKLALIGGQGMANTTTHLNEHLAARGQNTACGTGQPWSSASARPSTTKPSPPVCRAAWLRPLRREAPWRHRR